MNNNNHYNNLTNTDITRLGIQNSFTQSQQIKPNELLINDDMMNITNKRHGFDENNKVITQLTDEILTLNNKVQSLYIQMNDYDKIKSVNNDYEIQISDLKKNADQNKIMMSNLKIEIEKLKKLIYEKYNTEMYSMLKNISDKYKMDFDIVHIISQQLNIKEVNKGTINELISGINKYKEKSKEVNLS
tara:strand:+ start:238 stop:801 length:564 start_codon:yes stop_codon:yes gene_type:complete